MSEVRYIQIKKYIYIWECSLDSSDLACYYQGSVQTGSFYNEIWLYSIISENKKKGSVRMKSESLSLEETQMPSVEAALTSSSLKNIALFLYKN